MDVSQKDALLDALRSRVEELEGLVQSEKSRAKTAKASLENKEQELEKTRADAHKIVGQWSDEAARSKRRKEEVQREKAELEQKLRSTESQITAFNSMAAEQHGSLEKVKAELEEEKKQRVAAEEEVVLLKSRLSTSERDALRSIQEREGFESAAKAADERIEGLETQLKEEKETVAKQLSETDRISRDLDRWRSECEEHIAMLQKNKEQLEDKSTQLQSKSEEFDSTKAALIAAESENTTLKDAKTTLQEKLLDVSEKLQDFVTENRVLKEELSQGESSLTQANADLTSARKEIAALTSEKETAAADLETLRELHENLSAERDVIQSKLDSGNIALEAADTTAVALQQELEAALQKVDDAAKLETSLREDLADNRDSLITMEKGFSEQTEELQRINIALDETLTELANAKQSLEEKTDLLAKSILRAEELNTAYKAEHELYETTKTDLESATRQRDDFKESLNGLTQLLEEKENTNASLRGELEKAEGSLSTLTVKYDEETVAHNTSAAALQDELNTTRTELTTRVSLCDDLADQVHTLKTELDTAKKTYELLQLDRDSLATAKTSIEEELADSQKQAAALQGELSARTAELHDATSVNADLQTKLEAANTAQEETERKLKDALDEVEGLVAQRDGLSEELTQTNQMMESHITEIREERDGLMEQLETAKEDLIAAHEDYNGVKRLADDTHSELARLKIVHSSAKTTADRLEKSNSQFAEQLADAKKRLDLHAMERKNTDEKLAKMQRTIDQLNSQVSTERSESSKLRSELSDLDTKRVDTHSKITSLTKDLAAEKEAMEKARDDCARYKQAATSTKEQYGKLKDAFEQLKDRCVRDGKTIEEVTKDRNETVRDRDDVARKYNSLFEMYRELKSRYESVSANANSGSSSTAASAGKDNLVSLELKEQLRKMTTLCATQEEELTNQREETRRLRQEVGSMVSRAITLEELQKSCGLAIQPVNINEGPRRMPKRRSQSSDPNRHQKVPRQVATTAQESNLHKQ